MSGSRRSVSFALRAFCLSWACLAFQVPVAFGQQPADTETINDLPLLEVMELPSAEQLLTEVPVDWVIFEGEQVLIVEPLKDRPRVDDPSTAEDERAPDALQKIDAAVMNVQAEIDGVRMRLQKRISAIQKKYEFTAEEKKRLRGDTGEIAKGRREKVAEESRAATADAESEIASIRNRLPALRDSAQVRAGDAADLTVYDLIVTVVGDVLGAPYMLDRRLLSEVRYHERLVLERVEALRQRGTRTELETAWELIQHVQRRDPLWPGLAESVDRLMFSDASRMIREGEVERGLNVLDALRDRLRARPDAGTNDSLPVSQPYAAAISGLTNEAFREGDWVQARHFLDRLRRHHPRDPVVASLSGRLESSARNRLDEARSERDVRRAAELARQAALIWPRLRGLDASLDRLMIPHPVIHVGVRTAAAPSTDPRLDGAPQWRHAELSASRLFRPVALDADLVRFGSPVVRDWTPSDLGRRVDVQLMESRPPGAPQPLADAYQVSTSLLAAVDDPSEFGDRFGSVLRGVRPVTSRRIDLRLGQRPLRLDALLATLPLSTPGPWRPTGPGEFSPPASSGEAAFARTLALPMGGAGGAVAEVVEHSFGNPDEIIRALRRGWVDMVVDVPPSLVARVRGEVSLRDVALLDVCGLPATHIVQFRPGSVLAEQGELRRALAVALDRGPLLDEAFLHGVASPLARLTPSLMPSFSYGRDGTLPLRAQDRFAATSLGLLAKRKMGEAASWGPWRFLTPEGPEVAVAAEAMVEQWRSAGFPVELIPASERADALASGEWDLIYRRVRVVEPLVDLWPLLAMKQRARLGELGHLPETVRRLLIALESPRDWVDATDKLRRLDRAVWAETLVIPLWEIDRVTLRRRSIRDVPPRPLEPYSGIADWTVEPLIP